MSWTVCVSDERGETIAADEWALGDAPRDPALAAAHRVSMVHLPDDDTHEDRPVLRDNSNSKLYVNIFLYYSFSPTR